MAAAPASSTQWWRLASLIAIFFGCMAAMEVVLEAATRNLELDAFGVGMVMTCGQFTGCVILALASGGLRNDGGDRSWLPYMGLVACVFGGTGLPNIAAGWVQYPVKVLFKSSKLIPTMLVSVLMANSKSFTWAEYAAAALMCMGTAGFSFKPGQADTPSNYVTLGLCLLFLSTICDALASNVQQRLMQKLKVPPMHLMLKLNSLGALGSILLLAFSGDAGNVIEYAQSDYRLVAYAAGVGSCLGVAVWANTQLINEAGSVVAVGVATLRKVFTMVLSYLIFPKPVTWIHALSLVLVGAGLALSSMGFGGAKDDERQSLKDAAPISKGTDGDAETKV